MVNRGDLTRDQIFFSLLDFFIGDVGYSWWQGVEEHWSPVRRVRYRDQSHGFVFDFFDFHGSNAMFRAESANSEAEDHETRYYVNGNFDDVRIDSRALSATEVQQLYLNGGISPTLASIPASQGAGTKFVDFSYDLTSPQGNPVAASTAVSTNNGPSFNLPVTSISPANGSSVTPGDHCRLLRCGGVVLGRASGDHPVAEI